MAGLGFKQEPVAWVAAAHAIVAVAVGFGVHITNEQLALIDTALTAIAAVIIRQNVYAPVNKQGQPIMGGQNATPPPAA